MSTEILVVAEENLPEVIEIIRAGLSQRPRTTPVVRAGLEAWCLDIEEYMAEDAAHGTE